MKIDDFMKEISEICNRYRLCIDTNLGFFGRVNVRCLDDTERIKYYMDNKDRILWEDLTPVK